MKQRAIAVIDYNFDGVKEAAAKLVELENYIAEFCKGDNRVTLQYVDMRERRGDSPPDISNMKFRT